MDTGTGAANQRRISRNRQDGHPAVSSRGNDMNSSTPSYHETASPETVPTPAIRDFRFLKTDDLLSEFNHLAEWRLDLKARSADTSYFDATLTPMLKELEGRKRLREAYQDDPLCPVWPDTRDQRYQRLLADARDLKAIWPLERYLATVVGVDLRQSGRHATCRCPLGTHDDTTLSFVAYPDDHFHCYGCGKHGDIFTLTGVYFGIDSFADQVRKVEAITGTMVESARIIVANEEQVIRDIEAVLS